MGTVGCCWRQRAALVVVKPPLELGADPQNEDVEGFCDMVQEKRGCDGNKSVLENMHSHLLRAAEIQCFGGFSACHMQMVPNQARSFIVSSSDQIGCS